MQQPTDGPRVNEQIRIKEVRAISADGKQLGVIPTREALRLAAEAGLDLVEVQPNLKPPVCKMMDFGKFLYQQKKTLAEQKKNQKVIETKQMKFGPAIEKHDFDTKVNRIKEFIEEGNKCLTSVYFSGRSVAHPEVGADVLKRVAEALKEIASVEGQVKLEGKVMSMMLVPGVKKVKEEPVKPPAPSQEAMK